jgi:hypothetical protein
MRRRVPVHPTVIQEMFDWNDSKKYEWNFKGIGSEHHILHVAGPVIGVGFIIPAISYVVGGVFVAFAVAMVSMAVAYIVGVQRFGSTENMEEAVKLWCGIGLTIILLLAVVYLFYSMFFGSPKKKTQAESKLSQFLTTSIGINAFILSNLIARGFIGSVDSFRQWLRFFADHALKAVSLDFSEVFDVHFSNIEPHTWYGRLGTVSFRFLIAAGLVNFLWLVYRRRFYSETVSGTVKECFWKCQNMLDRDTVELRREGKVESFQPPEPTIALVDFIDALDDQDYRDGLSRKGQSRPQ